MLPDIGKIGQLFALSVDVFLVRQTFQYDRSPMCAKRFIKKSLSAHLRSINFTFPFHTYQCLYKLFLPFLETRSMATIQQATFGKKNNVIWFQVNQSTGNIELSWLSLIQVKDDSLRIDQECVRRGFINVFSRRNQFSQAGKSF